MDTDRLIITDNLGNKLYEVYLEDKTVFDYTNNEVLNENEVINFFEQLPI